MKTFTLPSAVTNTLIAAFDGPDTNLDLYMKEQKESFGTGYMSEGFAITHDRDADGKCHIPSALSELIGDAFDGGTWDFGLDFMPLFPQACDHVGGNVYVHIYLYVEGDNVQWVFGREGYDEQVPLNPGTVLMADADCRHGRSWIVSSDFTKVENAGSAALYIAAVLPEDTYTKALDRLYHNICSSDLYKKVAKRSEK